MNLDARLAPLLLALACSPACSPASGVVDPESLGYGPGPGRDLADGYLGAEGSPFERPPPVAWPLHQQPLGIVAGEPPVLPPTSPPVVPSDDTRRLCSHVVEFLLGQSGEPLDAVLLADACHLQARTEKLARTGEQWQRFSTCMLAAQTEPAFDECETLHPNSFAEPSDHPREHDVCEHMAMTLLFEERGTDTNLPAGELELYRPVVGKCLEVLLTKDQPKRSPEEYASMLDCVLEQSTSAAMEACE